MSKTTLSAIIFLLLGGISLNALLSLNQNRSLSLVPSPTQTSKQTRLITPVKKVESAHVNSLSEKNPAKVTKVIDGDTIIVNIDGNSQTLRLIGIDTPETQDPRKPVQCFGKQASEKAKELLDGKNVFLENDTTQGELDKYGRLLRYVFLDNGTFYNKLMIREGFAYEYTYALPYKYQADFKNAQKEAAEEKKGLWADDACSNDFATPTSSSTVGNYTCEGKTKCSQMVTCDEAKYYLYYCGLTRLDGDKDGVPCESLCN